MFCMNNILIVPYSIYIVVLPLVTYTKGICYMFVFSDVSCATYIGV